MSQELYDDWMTVHEYPPNSGSVAGVKICSKYVNADDEGNDEAEDDCLEDERTVKLPSREEIAITLDVLRRGSQHYATSIQEQYLYKKYARQHIGA